MPRGIYDRSTARPRRRKARRTTKTTSSVTTSNVNSANASLSMRIQQLSSDLSALSGGLAALSDEVQRTEGLQNAINQYMQAQSAAGAPTATAPARRRGRPPGSKNRPKSGTNGRRGPGRPRGSKNRPKTEAAAEMAPRRGPGRPRKNAVLG